MNGDASIAVSTVEWRISDDPVPYPEAEAAMRARAAAIRAGEAAEQVWLLQHPPLYTAGVSARAEELVDAERFPTFRTGRGGHWTYHGPGQRVAYVMLDLTRPHGGVPANDVRCFVNGPEEWLIRTLARFNVKGERRNGRVGIWVVDPARGTEAKIAAVGVRVTRWVSWHGIALNIDPDLDHFRGIIPCGITQHGVTSLLDQGITTTMAEVDVALRQAWDETFGADGQVCAI